MKYVLLCLLLAFTACGPSEPVTESQPQLAESKVGNGELARWQAQAANTSIIRDHWGIPHIYGKTDADAVFGMLYAQAEDDFNRIEMNYINGMGRLAEVEGETELYRDLRMRLFIDPANLQAKFAESPPWLQDLMRAFADGLNYYLHTHPEVQPRLITRFEPWMALSFSEGSIGGDIEQISIANLANFYGGERLLAQAADTRSEEPGGSNGFAIAPQNTVNGNALLLINPHTSFFFREELHVVSEQGLNAYGAVTWGQFFVYQGFNDKTGWMHTSSRADAIDEYLETIVQREDGYDYLYNAELRPLKETLLTLKYKTDTGMASREITVYHSHHGPIIREQDGKWVSIKLMQEPVVALTQSFQRSKAQNYADFYRTMEMLTNSSNNTVYADADGNIAYFHGNFIPRRDLRFNWNQPLDGSDPATEWQGLHSVDEIITLFNPPNGWIQNTNNWPFSAAGLYSPRREHYPLYMVNNPENPRGLNAVRVLENKTDFTLESLKAAAYDPTLIAFETLLPALFTSWEGLSDSDSLKAGLLGPISLLRFWNYQYSESSVETSLAVYWAEELLSVVRNAASAANRDIYAYMAEDAGAEQQLGALQRAVAKLVNDFGNWQTPWGEINRYQRLNGDIEQQFDDNAPSLPVAFASSTWGSLAAFGSRSYPGTKRMYGTRGNSFVAVVEFGERVTARAVTAGGLSHDPGSRHFADQARMYAQGELRDVYFYPEDVAANALRHYRPGER